MSCSSMYCGAVQYRRYQRVSGTKVGWRLVHLFGHFISSNKCKYTHDHVNTHNRESIVLIPDRCNIYSE